MLEITSEIIDSKIILNCPLLNEQDAFKVKVIGDNLDELSIEGRIDGVHQIKVYKETESTEEVVNKKSIPLLKASSEYFRDNRHDCIYTAFGCACDLNF